jgi:hypothetical protein
MARYEAGETLASIARTYDCSPPAISYIVSRSRARGVAPSAVAAKRPASPELPLVENDDTQTLVHEPEREEAETEPMPVSESRLPSLEATANQTNRATPRQGTSNGGREVPEEARSQRDDADERKNVDGARDSGSDDGPAREHRPQQTLHLSRAHGHDDPAAREPHHQSHHGSDRSDEIVASHLAVGQKDPGQSDGYLSGGNGADGRFVQDQRNSKEGGTFIDLALRHRVESDIAAFLAAFDAALNCDTSETRAELRRATDRLLRAGARTRIELERLEARAPLSATNRSGQPESSWRQR